MATLDITGPLPEDPEQLEQVYQAALKAGDTDSFAQAIQAGHTGAPDNLLYAAWYYRLQYAATRARGFAVNWAWALPLAVANGLLFWFLSAGRFTIQISGPGGVASADFMPSLVLLAAPLALLFVLAYLTVSSRKDWRLAALAGGISLAAALVALLTYPQAGPRPFQEQYLILMAIHLPLLAWACTGAFLIAHHRDPSNRFAFLIKSLEAFVVGGLFAMAGGLFTAISIGLFAALDIELPLVTQRLFIAGWVGLVGVIAVAVVYNPRVPPAEQSFEEGLSRLVALMMRVMLPLALLVLLVYLLFIPFNFRAPFDNRDVLIIYNGMLFAVFLLLVGATPIRRTELTPRMGRLLRLGIIGVAGLALLVSLYALAAILYRTGIDRLTPNRFTFIGWNIVNAGLLLLLLIHQAQAKAGDWLAAMYRTFAVATIAYAVWTLIVILAVPWLFGSYQGDVESLPGEVQQVVYQYEGPILLKCQDSPHIYLLEEGEKRWIDTIETFEARGYDWRDVHFITCSNLRAIPAGEPIPEDAGPPPEP